jgi:hypothetical protein
MNRRLIRPALTLSALLVLALGLLPSPVAAFHEANVHLEGGAWFPSLDAEARSSSFGLGGTLVTESDLGLDDPDFAPFGAITLRLVQRHTLRIEGFAASVDGSGQIDRSINFDGRTYPVGTGVTSEADVVFAGVDYGYDVVHTEQFALGLTLGVRFVSAEASISAPILNQKGQGEFQTALPALGLRMVLHPIPAPLFSSLALTARLAGGTIGDEGSFIDADAGIEWLPIPILAIRVGYRYFKGQGEHDDDEADVTLSGPYASLTLAF